MSEASTSHRTRLTFLVRLLVLLGAAFVLVMLAPTQARADGVVEGVLGGAGDTVGSVVTTTTQAAEQAVSSTTEAVQHAVATMDAALRHAVSSTERTVRHAVTAAGRAASDRGLERASGPKPSSGIPPVHVPPVSHSHRHHGGASERHIVPDKHPDAVVAPTAASTIVPPASPDPAGEGRAAASSSRHRPLRPGSGGGGAVPAGSGSIDLGARGGQLAAILVATLLLASAWSRWRRPWAVARAPNPLVPILVPPG